MYKIPPIESRFSPEFLARLDQENRRNIFAELDELTLTLVPPGIRRESREELAILLTLKFDIIEKVDRLITLSMGMTQKDISYRQLQSVHEEFLFVFQSILKCKELIRTIMLRIHE